MVNWIEVVGFFAFGLNVWGNWLMTKKNARGWWIRIACNLVQLIYAVLIWSPSFAVSALVFMGINIRGIVEWRRPDQGHSPYCALKQMHTFTSGSIVKIVCNCGRLA